MRLNIIIINNSHVSRNVMSGGEKIAMEFARRWGEKVEVFLYASNLGVHIWNKYKVNNIKKIEFMKLKENSSVLNYFRRAVFGVFKLSKVRFVQDHINIVYSASDFWPDSIPALIIKLKNRNVEWIAGFYLFAPKPWRTNSPYKGKRWLIGLFYWLTQLPIYWIVRKFADMVFVTSEPDVEKFVTKKRGREKILAVRGGVDTAPSEEYLNSENVKAIDKRKYDACFIGRFHYQKGVLELVDIWRMVTQDRPHAKLAMIGVGPLQREIMEKINKLGLDDNILLLGFRDGEEKYEIFKESKVVVHPATYDSGGMAACEAMAWGLPGVSFDLEALKTYYPQGMIKTPCFDLKVFAENIIKLLEDKELYNNTREDAIAWAREWKWDKKAAEIFQQIRVNLLKI